MKVTAMGSRVPELCRAWPMGAPRGASGSVWGHCLVPRAWRGGWHPCQPGSSLLGQPPARCPLSSAESKVEFLLSKRCAPRCPNTNMAYAWLSEPWLFRRIARQCCNVSFCNAAPPAPGRPWARPGRLLLPLGLSLLAASQ